MEIRSAMPVAKETAAVFRSPSPWVTSVDVGLRIISVKLLEAVISCMGSTIGRTRAVVAGAGKAAERLSDRCRAK